MGAPLLVRPAGRIHLGVQVLYSPGKGKSRGVDAFGQE